jgi:hypothetical protein
MIEIDGIKYNAEWKSNSFELTADIINGDNSGRLQGTKSMFLDYIGTFFNSGGEIVRGLNCSDDEWDNLFIALSNPINNHTVKIPFKQGHLKTEIYVSQVKTKLLNKKNQRNRWGNSIAVTFTAMDSQWLAGSQIEGYMEE